MENDKGCVMNQNKTLTAQDELTEFLLYTTPNNDVKVEIYLNNETVWLPQKRIAELFGVNVPAISKHLNNIYEDGELEKEATISILETVQKEGNRKVKREVEFYNLDAILSVGYRVNSSYFDYDKFNKTQKIESDFAREMKRVLEKGSFTDE